MTETIGLLASMSSFSNVIGLDRSTCPEAVVVTVCGKVTVVKVEEGLVMVEVIVEVFVISTVGSVVVAVAKAPTFGKSFIFIKSSYKLCENVSVPMSKNVVVLSGTFGTEAAN